MREKTMRALLDIPKRRRKRKDLYQVTLAKVLAAFKQISPPAREKKEGISTSD